MFIRPIAVSLLVLCAAHGFAQTSEVVIADGKTRPENLSVSAGALITGSAASPYIYRLKKGAAEAEKFVDVSADTGSTFLGVLADPASKTLWACQLQPGPAPAGGGRPNRKSALRGFDLTTGAAKLRWDLPGDSNTCNDIAIAPDKSLYIADTSGKIYRMAAGAQAGELFLQSPEVAGIDGITFFNGALYFNSIFASKIYRVPMDAAGKAATPVELALDTPVNRPDGMRSGKGKIFVAENGGGRVDMLTLTGDTAKVTVLKEGLATPTGVEPDGDTLWFTEYATGKVMSLPIPK